VRPECLAFALETQQVHGVWGGMGERERARLMRSRRLSDGSLPRERAPAPASSAAGAAPVRSAPVSARALTGTRALPDSRPARGGPRTSAPC
jgi:hypothetical protein